QHFHHALLVAAAVPAVDSPFHQHECFRFIELLDVLGRQTLEPLQIAIRVLRHHRELFFRELKIPGAALLALRVEFLHGGAGIGGVGRRGLGHTSASAISRRSPIRLKPSYSSSSARVHDDTTVTPAARFTALVAANAIVSSNAIRWAATASRLAGGRASRSS